MSFDNLVRDLAQYVVEKHRKDIQDPNAQTLLAMLSLGKSEGVERDRDGRRKKDIIPEKRKSLDELEVIEAEFVEGGLEDE